MMSQLSAEEEKSQSHQPIIETSFEATMGEPVLVLKDIVLVIPGQVIKPQRIFENLNKDEQDELLWLVMNFEENGIMEYYFSYRYWHAMDVENGVYYNLNLSLLGMRNFLSELGMEVIMEAYEKDQVLTKGDVWKDWPSANFAERYFDQLFEVLLERCVMRVNQRRIEQAKLVSSLDPLHQMSEGA